MYCEVFMSSKILSPTQPTDTTESHDLRALFHRKRGRQQCSNPFFLPVVCDGTPGETGVLITRKFRTRLLTDAFPLAFTHCIHTLVIITLFWSRIGRGGSLKSPLWYLFNNWFASAHWLPALTSKPDTYHWLPIYILLHFWGQPPIRTTQRNNGRHESIPFACLVSNHDLLHGERKSKNLATSVQTQWHQKNVTAYWMVHARGNEFSSVFRTISEFHWYVLEVCKEELSNCKSIPQLEWTGNAPMEQRALRAVRQAQRGNVP